ncbi:MAG: hypothetical protein R6U13_08450 [Desulfatiglandaceae bacterium]
MTRLEFPDERFDLLRRSGFHTRHFIVVSEAVVVVVIGFLECQNDVLTRLAPGRLRHVLVFVTPLRGGVSGEPPVPSKRGFTDETCY